jgi:hypothetical protein
MWRRDGLERGDVAFNFLTGDLGDRIGFEQSVKCAENHVKCAFDAVF